MAPYSATLAKPVAHNSNTARREPLPFHRRRYRRRIRRLGGNDLGARDVRLQPPAIMKTHCWTSQQWHTLKAPTDSQSVPNNTARREPLPSYRKDRRTICRLRMSAANAPSIRENLRQFTTVSRLHGDLGSRYGTCCFTQVIADDQFAHQLALGKLPQQVDVATFGNGHLGTGRCAAQ